VFSMIAKGFAPENGVKVFAIMEVGSGSKLAGAPHDADL